MTYGGLGALFAWWVGSSSADVRSPEPKPLCIRVNSDGRLPYDPATTGFAHLTFYGAVLGKLARMNENLTVEPDLLSEAYWDFTRKRYVLKLAAGLNFHNGRAVTAEDLEFSLVRFFFSQSRVDQVAFLGHIVGLSDVVRGTPYEPWKIAGVQKLDDRTVAVKLDTMNPAFLYSLTEGWISLVPREELRADHVTWKTHPVGAGPYRVQAVAGGAVDLLKAGAGAGPKRIRFESDPAVECDVVGYAATNRDIERLKKVVGFGPVGFTGVFFNAGNALSGNLHFRRAVALGLNRAAITEGLPDVNVLHETLPSSFYGRLGTKAGYNVEAARRELRRVPAALRTRDIKAHWFTGRTELTSAERRVVDRITEDLAVVGIDVRFSASPHPTFAEDDVQTVFRLDDRGTAFPDPTIIFKAFERPGFLSRLFPSDRAVLGSLLREAAAAQSPDVKAAAIFHLSSFFRDQAVLVPLYERKTIYYVNPARVRDLHLRTGISFDVDRIELTKKGERE